VRIGQWGIRAATSDSFWEKDSGGAVGEQDGDAVDDGVVAAASGAAHGVGLPRERVAADGANEPAEVFGPYGHMRIRY
jgi:hypothetical protein